MICQSPQKRRIATAKIVTIYALFGLAWIYGSDTVLGWLVNDPAIMVKLSVVKGSLFILCTATLLYFLISRFAQQLSASERKMIESLKYYEAIFNATNEAIFIHDAQSGRTLDVNDRMLEIFGYERDEALTVDIGQLSAGTPPYTQAEAVENLRKALLEGPQVFEWLCRRKTGELFWAEVSLRRITTYDSGRIIAVARDISERKRAEEELRQSHMRLASFAEATFEAIVESDAGRILDCNEQLALMLDYPAEELRGMDIAGFIAPEDRDWVMEKVQQNLESTIECAMLRKDGTRVFVEAHSCPMSHGSVKRYTAIRDINESKQAKKTIQESEEKFRSIFEQSLDAIFLSSRDGAIDAANPAACKMFGMTEQELCKSGRSGIVNHTDHRLALLLEERKRTGKIIAELTFIRKNGEQFPVEISSVIVPDDPQRSIIILRDITERKNAELALQKVHCELELRVKQRTEELASTVDSLLNEISEREKAENALRVETDERLKAIEALREKEQMLIQQSRQAAMGEMISNIAHQWRQPLNILAIQVQQLLLLYDCGEFTRELLNSNVNDSMKLIQHMSRTIDDFRNYFKPDKVKIEFELSEVIANTLSLIEDSFRNEQIRIEVITNDDPVITGYRNEFAQVILNILNNARDVLIEREISDPKVTITIFTESDRAVVSIADNAGGIPEEIMGKIFDPYFTTKGPQTGTGVGLFMSKSIIEKNMSGRLTVRNAANGAEFRIEV